MYAGKGRPVKTIFTSEAPAAVGPYSQAVSAGGLIFCSGQIAIAPETGTLITGDVAQQTRQVLKNLAAVLDAAGACLGHVTKATIYLQNMDDFAAVNEVYAEAFGNHRPARACVEVSRLPKDVAVEIDAIAWVGE